MAATINLPRVLRVGAGASGQLVATLAELGLALVSGPIREIDHENGHIRAVLFAGAAPVGVEAFYLASTTEPAAPLAAQLGCAFADGPAGVHVETDRWQRTSVSGVFAAGDLASPTPAAIFAAAAGATAGLGCDMDLAGLLPA